MAWLVQDYDCELLNKSDLKVGQDFMKAAWVCVRAVKRQTLKELVCGSWTPCRQPFFQKFEDHGMFHLCTLHWTNQCYISSTAAPIHQLL